MERKNQQGPPRRNMGLSGTKQISHYSGETANMVDDFPSLHDHHSMTVPASYKIKLSLQKTLAPQAYTVHYGRKKENDQGHPYISAVQTEL